MADGQVVFEISADNRDALRAIDQTTDALEDAGREWESNAGESADSISDKFTDMFKKISAAAVAAKVGQALLDFGKDAIQAASDLEEVQNVVDTTFGAGASRINEWAKTASTSFGLTELQAKQFTSTLGAMMKSSGLAGDQIIDMSTDLAGLAADMASFYNLDFETAFQKIRSGISGETEPLKQLGINMSVVNLEAFALTQGITKAFSEMSQGEQTMLRYQYIMQATADAQGDFADTSKGYANSLRLLESQIDDLKAKMGKPLLDVISGATGFLNDFIGALTAEKPKTLLDKVADINIDEETKVAQIQAVAAQATSLLDTLETLNTNTGLKSDGELVQFFNGFTESIGKLDEATDTNIPEKLGNLTSDIDGVNVPDGKYTEALAEITGSVGELETKLGDNQVEENAVKLAGGLNPEVGDTIADSIGGIVEKLTASDQDIKDSTIPADVTALAGGLNPEVEKSIAETVAKINEDLDTEAGEIKNSEIPQNVTELAGSLNPAIDESIADKVAGIAAALDAEDSKIKGSTIPADVQNLSEQLNPAVDESIADTVGKISAGLASEDEKIKASAIPTDVQNLSEKLNPTVDESIADTVKGIADNLDVDGARIKGSEIPSDVQGIADNLNPTVEESIADTVKGIADDLDNDDSRFANSAIPADVQSLSGKLNPTVEKSIADTVSGIADGLDAGDKRINENTLPTDVQSLSEKLDPTVEKSIANTVEGIAEGLQTQDEKIQGNTLPADVKNIADNLNPTVQNDGNLAASIGEIAENIGTLTEKIGGAQSADVSGELGKIAGGANSLTSGTATEWQAFANAISGIGSDAPTNLQGVANALSTEVGGDATKWENLLSAIKNNAGDALAAIGDNDGSSTKAFLENVAAGADDYTTDYSAYWTNLLGVLGDKAGAAISALDGGSAAGTALGDIAENANTLDAPTSTRWSSFLNVFKDFVNKAGDVMQPDAGAGIRSIAEALVNAPAEEKAAAWKTFLDALGANTGVLTSLTGKSAEESAAWLQTIADGVKKAELSPEDANTWSTLLGAFVEGMPNLRKSQEGEEFYQELINDFLALGKGSQVAEAGLAALGYETDDITTMQDRWLTICRQLVKTIPELSSIINTETGAVKGGTKAVQEYINTWTEERIIQARIDSLKEKKDALQAELENDRLTDIAIAKSKAAAEIWANKSKFLVFKDPVTGKTGEAQNISQVVAWLTERENQFLTKGTTELDESLTGRVFNSQMTAFAEFDNALMAYNQSKKDIPIVMSVIEVEEEYLNSLLDEAHQKMLAEADATEEATHEMTLMEKAANGNAEALANVTTAIDTATNAFKELADYQERVRDETEQSIKSTITGFEKIETAGQRARKTFAEITKGENESAEAYNKRYTEAQNAVPSLQKMTQGLQSQLEYMQEYQNLLTQARAKGVSEDLLATLSDGSQESFDYLYALVHTEGSIEALNQAYADVQEEASKFTDELTTQKLKVDETYKSLVTAAQEAAAGLNVSGEAYISVEETINSIADALSDNKEKVQKQVDEILEQIARLNVSGSFGTGFGLGGGLIFKSTWGGKNADDGTFANGIDNIPYDGFLAVLHQGERIQTAAEADLARRYSYQQPAFDYDMMGGAIGANIPRGNVYLDGQTVGRVIGDRQANSYRALERSGWQA